VRRSHPGRLRPGLRGGIFGGDLERDIEGSRAHSDPQSRGHGNHRQVSFYLFYSCISGRNHRHSPGRPDRAEKVSGKEGPGRPDSNPLRPAHSDSGPFGLSALIPLRAFWEPGALIHPHGHGHRPDDPHLSHPHRPDYLCPEGGQPSYPRYSHLSWGR